MRFITARPMPVASTASHSATVSPRSSSSRSAAKMEKDERSGAAASVVGAALARAALSKSRRVFYTVGFVYQLVIFLMRLLPSTAANAILGKMYAE